MKIYKQETDKSCGIACLRSILNHYGNNFSEKDIWDKHSPFQTKSEGIRNPILNLGVTALKFGFDVTYIGYNPIITNNNHSDDLKKSLQEKSKTYFDYGKFYVEEALKFLELKGKLKIEKLNIEKIKKIIDENKFALVEIKPAFINKNGSINMNHKVIIVGYTKKGFKILNPSDAKEHLWDFDTFLLAFYAATPELLIIKNKK
ncbi:MAG: cysteine peptidase family C39 domain-containing protein [Candidatus Pacearchaeota archaeon]